VDEVLRMRREGARDAYIATLRDAEQLTDEEIAAPEVQEEIEQYVEDFTTPGDSSEAPEIDDPTAESVARGKGVYATFGCISCHGAEGKGDGVQEMFDVETMPTRPRDFTLGIFKGNPDPASLYRRIAYGMPGTPMPGSSTMTPEQRVDLVHFIRSMSTEEQRQAATLSRQRIVAARVPKIDDPEDDSLWAQAPAARMQVMPLWWRTAPDPELTVQAIHDGEVLAVRLSWLDATEEAHALASETFKDAAAMQLYRGAREPFLGMGVAATPVDVWFWDADHQGPPAAVEDVHPRMVVDQYPFSESAVASAEFSRDAARTANQPDVSLPAKAAGNRVTPVGDSPGASSLSGGGPGTVTFRPPMSQIVTAHGVWADGRWTVVMKRPLAPAADEGLVVHPGEAASVAFAVWDGAQRDRDGQKLITIWQDLELAK
jgi:DMSO reductase family type II enzyme heme b subunit